METDKLTKLATERVRKARAELILTRRFYGVLVSNVEPVPSREVPTMATNGKKHFFNPEFIDTLTQDELLFVQAHESEHDARKHHSRRGNRDPKLWNEAGDYVINPDLIEEGFKAPDWILLDPRFKGLAVEDAYRILELERQQQPPEPDEDDSDDADEDDSDEDEDNGEDTDVEPEDEDADDGDDESDETTEGDNEADEDEGDEEADGGEGDEGDDEGDDTGNGGDEGDEADDEADEGEGTGGDAGNEADESEGEQGESEQPGKGGEQSSGDPGRCGEVLDAPPESEGPDSDQKWERVVRQAASMSRAVGQLPDHIAREIERANKPSQDWREVLRAWIDQGSKQIETWNKPNRRFIGGGLYLPGSQRDGLNRVVFLIDVSSSMDDVALAMVRNEAQAALDEGAIDEVVVVYCNTEITRIDTYRETDEIAFDAPMGGGTDMRPAFKWIEENVDASLIIYFGDLFIGDAGPQPSCPVLFAVTGNPVIVKQLIETAPWASPGIYIDPHV